MPCDLLTRFILIEPSHPGNVGAVARAMKTMGFDGDADRDQGGCRGGQRGELVLVRPRWRNVLNREETIQRASGALDVLAQCRIVDTLEQALGGITHICATVMTPRDFGPPTRSPRVHLASLVAEPDFHEQRGIAFLFGSERYGMRNQDVYGCHVALSIDTHPRFGSLNLACAVQLIAYEWRMALALKVAGETPLVAHAKRSIIPPLADAAQLSGVVAHWEGALMALGFLDPQSPKKLLPRLQQLLNRAALREDEVHILRGIAKSIQDASWH